MKKIRRLVNGEPNMLETIRKMIFQDIIITINKYFISLSIFLIFTIIIVYISEKLGIKRFFF